MSCLNCQKDTKSKGGYIKKFCCGKCQNIYNVKIFNINHEALKCEHCGKDLFNYNGKKIIKKGIKRFCNKSCKMKNINPMHQGNVYDHWVNKFGKKRADELESNRSAIQSVKTSKKLKGVKILDHFIKKHGERGYELYEDYINNQKIIQKEAQLKRWNNISSSDRKEFSKKFIGKRNGMYGKPTPQGSGNGWSGWYKEFYFRSLKELKLLLICNRLKINIKTAESKEFRINYIDYKNSNRTAVPDFIIDNKYIIEIKPKHLQNSFDNKAKFLQFNKLAKKKGMIFRVIDTGKMNIDKFIELYNNKEIQLIKRYEDKVNDYSNKKN